MHLHQVVLQVDYVMNNMHPADTAKGHSLRLRVCRTEPFTVLIAEYFVICRNF